MAESPEVAIDPDLPIWDAHHHLYRDGSAGHGSYLGCDYLSDIRQGHRIVGSTVVESEPYRYGSPDGSPDLAPASESAWIVSSLPDTQPAALVGFADMLTGDRIEAVVDAHQAAAGARFRGVRFRRVVAGRPDAGGDIHMAEPVHEAMRVLQQRGLVYESSFPFDEIDSFAALARAFPDQPMVADHLAGFTLRGHRLGRDGMIAAWLDGLGRLALCRNVLVKLGSIGMPSVTDMALLDRPPSSTSLAEHWRPLMLNVIDLFGPERCMFESNFPVDRAQLPFVVLWNTFKRLTADFSHRDRSLMFQLTAQRTYGGAR